MQQSSKIESPLTHRSFPFLTAMRRIVLAEYVQGKNKMHRPDRDIQTLFGHFAFFRDPYNQKVYTSYDARIMASATSLFWGLTSWWPHLNLHEVLFARAPSDGCWPDFRSTETHTLSKHTTRCRPRQNMQWPNFLSADPRICDLHKTKSSTATPYVLNRFPSCRQMLMMQTRKERHQYNTKCIELHSLHPTNTHEVRTKQKQRDCLNVVLASGLPTRIHAKDTKDSIWSDIEQMINQWLMLKTILNHVRQIIVDECCAVVQHIRQTKCDWNGWKEKPVQMERSLHTPNQSQ